MSRSLELAFPGGPTPPAVVSVVLPVYNADGTITRAIASIRRQTFAEWELIVVEDGSTDGTLETVRALAAEDSRIQLVARDHAGIVSALNAGLAVARGTLIARMDADDEAHPERLAEQVAFLRAAEHRDVGLVSCLVDFGGDAQANAGYALHVEWINSLVTPESIALNRFVESPLAHPSVMFRRELIERFGGYRDGEFPEDYELWLRWLDAGVRMAKVPRRLLTWNDPPERLSRRHSRYSPEAFFRVKAEWLARWLRTNGIVERRRVLIWGAGRPTRKRADLLEIHGMTIAGYVDVDVGKLTPAIGGTGRPVISPRDLPPRGEVFVLGYVTSRGARDLIRAELRARGYQEGSDFLMCA